MSANGSIMHAIRIARRLYMQAIAAETATEQTLQDIAMHGCLSLQ
jgi:hypothetical protein